MVAKKRLRRQQRLDELNSIDGAVGNRHRNPNLSALLAKVTAASRLTAARLARGEQKALCSW